MNYSTKFVQGSMSLLLPLLFLIIGCTNDKETKTNIKPQDKDSIYNIVIWAKDSTTLPLKERKALLEKAYSQAKKEKSLKIRLKNLNQISSTYHSFNDTSRFKKLQEEYITLANQTKDYVGKGDAHIKFGQYYFNKQVDSAYYHFREAYNAYLQAKLKTSEIDKPLVALYYMGSIKERNKDYAGAEKEATQVITYAEENGLKDKLFPGYTLLGIIQNGLDNYDEAVNYHNQAKKYIKYTDPKRQDSYQYINQNNIGSTYLRSENYSEAKKIFNSLLASESLKTIRPKLYAKALSSYAYASYKEKSVFNDSLVKVIKQSNQLLDSINYTYDYARNYYFLADILAKKDKAKAIEYAYTSKNVALETENRDRLLSTLQLLTIIDDKNSAKHAEDYFNLNHRLQQEERRIRDKFARIQLETDQILDENLTLSKKNELYTKIGIATLVLGFGLFIIIIQRINNQKLRFNQRQQEKNEEIYDLMLSQQGKLEEGKKEAQRRISQELHDGILGEMLGIRLLLSGLNNRTDEASIAHRDELILKLQQCEEEIRTVSHELNAASHTKLGNFVSTIENYISQVSESSRINVCFNYDINFNWDVLPGELKINIYRIIQESLQNSIKHAQAEKAEITFVKEEDRLEVLIEDNGLGFDPNKERKGIGLKNINSRIAKLNGKVFVKSAPGKGTKIKLDIPTNLVY
ncbi:sensor histidine kinase [Croceivirga sp. JEA036]|uniref:tetratricopeptide repeat-containing sensor histidine kinase n=1 Tax=Croceivirga sp. JEA036 TaxID=2721162 RepID=UPI001438E4B9|nr:sensor histidine kinase [Croceivirga sp. JEA036]NJB35839.1 hypothetical protein [Croceivirga sp. JEA036]